ncbi:MAG TPA: ADP-glyceromanno-heptose 6-epimerase [Pseudobdellovibrionaceae bacterium]|nr:ADP-glyceromanno-heptose 6-epimerase [Pseudobdellovibrionaceae bacterium]
MFLITGATGFIGSALVWEFNNRGHNDLLLVDSVPPSVRDLTLRPRRYDRFVGKDELWSTLTRVRPRAVLHMGACSSTTELNVAFLTENNFEYTRRLWRWCADHRVPFIYASSGAVYGDGAQGFDDASPSKIFRPLNPYGESKAAFDRWVEAEGHRHAPPHWYGLRFFNVFGPNEYLKGDMASVVFKAFHQIRATGRLKLFKSHREDYRDGEQLRDFVYVKDITRWCAELIDRCESRTPVANGIYNMGFGRARSWNDLAGATFSAMGVAKNRDEVISRIDYIDIPVDMRPRYQYFTEARIDRLLAQGLSAPRWALEDAVKDYVTQHLLRLDSQRPDKGEAAWL